MGSKRYLVLAAALFLLPLSASFSVPANSAFTLGTSAWAKSAGRLCPATRACHKNLSVRPGRARNTMFWMLDSRGNNDGGAMDSDGVPPVLLTELDTAIRLNDLLLVQDLLKTKGADVDGGGDSYSGRTPLMQAASSGCIQIVQLMLDAGANPEAVDRFGRSVLMQAAMMGKKDVVKRIEKHIKSESGNKKKRTQTQTLIREATPIAQQRQGGTDLVAVDPSIDGKLWASLIAESVNIPGRPDLFEWRGRRLRQPVAHPDGGLVIVDDISGVIVYKGLPPQLTNTQQQQASPPSGAFNTEPFAVVKTAARLAVSPAVAVSRLASATVQTFTRRSGGGPSKTGAKGKTMKSQKLNVESLDSEEKLQPGFKSLKDHEADVRRIMQEVASRNADQLITLERKAGDSHCPRSDSYKASSKKINVASLNGILSVQQVNGGGWQALVEPRVTMEQLVRALLPYGLVPEVVPEFRRITVGGSIQGIAGESSSFEKGFFHDTCESYEIILGDGTLVLASPTNQYADIFEALPGTYGTLGILTAATIRLMRASPYVAMEYVPFRKLDDMMEYIRGALNGEDAFVTNPIDFLEGFGYAPDKMLIAQGRFVNEEDAMSGILGPIQKYNRWYSPWFFKRARRRQGTTDVIPTEDYIFRHDRGSFWMANYKMPHAVGRALGFALSSHKMYKLASALPKVFDKSQILLQDFMIPVENVVPFVEQLDHNLGVWPLWFCPLKNTHKKGLIFGVPANMGDFCNVGAYGIPRKQPFDFEEDNKLMEMIMLEEGGRKVHYSHAYYPQELFYGQIYDGDYYATLRARYHAEDVFPHVHEKIVTQGRNL